eukprot:5447008-Amphidinium_carterae.1
MATIASKAAAFAAAHKAYTVAMEDISESELACAEELTVTATPGTVYALPMQDRMRFPASMVLPRTIVTVNVNEVPNDLWTTAAEVKRTVSRMTTGVHSTRKLLPN